MKFAIDTSILVAFFLPEDRLHIRAKNLINKILSGEIEYACVSIVNIAEMGYVLERSTQNQEYSYNSIAAAYSSLNLDVITFSWDFLTTLSHLKAINPISFCDNATLTAAKLSHSPALFTKEREIVFKLKDKLKGEEILFIEDLSFK